MLPPVNPLGSFKLKQAYFILHDFMCVMVRVVFNTSKHVHKLITTSLTRLDEWVEQVDFGLHDFKCVRVRVDVFDTNKLCCSCSVFNNSTNQPSNPFNMFTTCQSIWARLKIMG